MAAAAVVTITTATTTSSFRTKLPARLKMASQLTDLRVGGSSPGLRVKLGGEDWLRPVHDALKATQCPRSLNTDGLKVLD